MAFQSDTQSLFLRYLTLERVQQLVGAVIVLVSISRMSLGPSLANPSQYTLYTLSIWFYNVYFHPLSRFPGPKLAAATPLYSGFYSVTGARSKWNAHLHSTYGEVVRVGPNALSFINDGAWRDIYMHRQGQQHRQMQKAFNRKAANGAWSIITAPDEVHGRLRRGLSHAFSEKALRDQEPLIKKYVDLLVSNLREDAEAGREVDMVAYLNFLTFDLIGDLAFAAPFDALKERTAHPWMKTFFRSIKMGQYIFSALLIPPLQPVIALLAPMLRKVQRKQFNYCKEKVNDRIASGSDRPDLMREVLKGNEAEEPGKGMSVEEIQATFDILMIAGSETTATLLSGCFSLLMRHPDVYERLKKEVRSAFENEDDITIVKVCLTTPSTEVVFTDMFPGKPASLPPRRP
jgi:cytochrome P450